MSIATIHLLPTARNTNRIFEIRRLAQAAGCQFIPNRKTAPSAPTTAPSPFTGGAA
ncbi:hypothetical protein ACIPK7_06390 [Pseudomonas sp. NPDC086581]|uniref:hypothetical protein n=1 Tax=Pseudomonas sp. NPDC086581 TaxID=3364432 RepID=UPI0037FE2EBF